VKIGRLRHRVTIEERSVTRDEFGGEVVTWSTFATCWAEISPFQGREFLEGRRLETELDTWIRIRYRSGVLPGMRVVWGDRTYGIEFVLHHDTGQRELRLMCRELGLDR